MRMIFRLVPNDAQFHSWFRSTLNGLIAQANNGTTIVLEHRFFGLSNPIDNLDDDSLQLLTIDQVSPF